jgi:hypothetical protein
VCRPTYSVVHPHYRDLSSCSHLVLARDLPSHTPSYTFLLSSTYLTCLKYDSTLSLLCTRCHMPLCLGCFISLLLALAANAVMLTVLCFTNTPACVSAIVIDPAHTSLSQSPVRYLAHIRLHPDSPFPCYHYHVQIGSVCTWKSAFTYAAFVRSALMLLTPVSEEQQSTDRTIAAYFVALIPVFTTLPIPSTSISCSLTSASTVQLCSSCVCFHFIPPLNPDHFLQHAAHTTSPLQLSSVLAATEYTLQPCSTHPFCHIYLHVTSCAISTHHSVVALQSYNVASLSFIHHTQLFHPSHALPCHTPHPMLLLSFKPLLTCHCSVLHLSFSHDFLPSMYDALPFFCAAALASSHR